MTRKCEPACRAQQHRATTLGPCSDFLLSDRLPFRSRRRADADRPVHNAAWKQTFDAFLQTWSAAARAAVRAVRSRRRLPPICRRPATRRRRPHLPVLAGHHPARGHPRRRSRRADRQRHRQPQERARAAEDHRRRGRRSTPARWTTCRRPRPPACAGPSSRPAPTARTCCEAAGIDGLPRGTGGRRGRPRASTCRASPRPTPSCTARSCSAYAPEQCAVFEDALAGVAAGRAGGFGIVVGVDRGRAGRGAAGTRCRHRRAGSVRTPDALSAYPRTTFLFHFLREAPP